MAEPRRRRYHANVRQEGVLRDESHVFSPLSDLSSAFETARSATQEQAMKDEICVV
jgi:hypothetical protein